MKIVILGCENSHAKTFLNFIYNNENFSDIEVVGLYSNEPEAAQKLAEDFQIPIMESYDTAVGMVDGVVITARHGDNHYKYAKPYIKSGVPMFIDKPITISEEEAVDFMRECQAAGVRVVGGSSCKHADAVREIKEDVINETDGKTLGGLVRCPLMPDSPYGGFFFYAQHLVEVVCRVFGGYPKTVKAFENGKTVTVVFRYEDYDVVGLYVSGSSCYYVERASKHYTKGLEFDMGEKLPFLREFEDFYDLLQGGSQPESYGDFIAPVFLMNAIFRSLENKGETEVNSYIV